MALPFSLDRNRGFESPPCCLAVSQAGSAELPLPHFCGVFSLEIVLKLVNAVLKDLLDIKL